MELLDLICSFYDIQYDVFELLKTSQSSNPEPEPITEIGVSYIDLRHERPPQQYEILNKSVSGRDGDIARHGNRKTYLYFKRSNEQKPITAITLISPENGEEVSVLYQKYDAKYI